MRITNRMMTNNMLYNINNNRIHLLCICCNGCCYCRLKMVPVSVMRRMVRFPLGSRGAQ